ncbi:MAG: hypothetical protein A3C13_02345 [Candidatus Lloydbacteria bacterium RIFCSPHIGHO2_02_FULL_50_11]|nr:MAG: hypothetical protein A3C13_02345 [Candidatus Lloydbacteria bacterium RIFCSPHIGHO2_02_FULL_50_11]
MAVREHLVRLWKNTNLYGATFWGFSVDTTCDGRGLGGLKLDIDIHAQKEGLCIAGNYISWDDLHKAEAYAKSHALK